MYWRASERRFPCACIFQVISLCVHFPSERRFLCACIFQVSVDFSVCAFSSFFKKKSTLYNFVFHFGLSAYIICIHSSPKLAIHPVISWMEPQAGRQTKLNMLKMASIEVWIP